MQDFRTPHKVQVLLHRAEHVDHLSGCHHLHLPPLPISTSSGTYLPTYLPKRYLPRQSEYNKIMINFAISLLFGFLPLVILQAS